VIRDFGHKRSVIFALEHDFGKIRVLSDFRFFVIVLNDIFFVLKKEKSFTGQINSSGGFIWALLTIRVSGTALCLHTRFKFELQSSSHAAVKITININIILWAVELLRSLMSFNPVFVL
jgi:hypothetical protein